MLSLSTRCETVLFSLFIHILLYLQIYTIFHDNTTISFCWIFRGFVCSSDKCGSRPLNRSSKTESSSIRTKIWNKKKYTLLDFTKEKKKSQQHFCINIPRLHVLKTVYAVNFKINRMHRCYCKIYNMKSFVNLFDPYKYLVFWIILSAYSTSSGFTWFDHVANQVHAPVKFLKCLFFTRIRYIHWISTPPFNY